MSADMSDSVKYIESGTGYGEITIVMPDGETLSGEYIQSVVPLILILVISSQTFMELKEVLSVLAQRLS